MRTINMDLGPLPETFTICSSLYVEYLTTFLNFFSIKDVSMYLYAILQYKDFFKSWSIRNRAVIYLFWDFLPKGNTLGLCDPQITFRSETQS